MSLTAIGILGVVLFLVILFTGLLIAEVSIMARYLKHSLSKDIEKL